MALVRQGLNVTFTTILFLAFVIGLAFYVYQRRQETKVTSAILSSEAQITSFIKTKEVEINELQAEVDRLRSQKCEGMENATCKALADLNVDLKEVRGELTDLKNGAEKIPQSQVASKIDRAWGALRSVKELSGSR